MPRPVSHMPVLDAVRSAVGGWHRTTRLQKLRGAVGIVPMPSDWAAPIDSIPSGTAHLAERYPPLPGDAAPPASFYDDAERWRSVAAEYRERGFVVVSVQPLPLRLPP